MKIFNLIIINILALSLFSCKKSSENPQNHSNPPCQSAVCGGNVDTPIDSSEDSFESSSEDASNIPFKVIGSFPQQDDNDFSTMGTINVQFSKKLADLNFNFSGTALDLIQLTGENGIQIQIDVNVSNNILQIKPKYALANSHRYSLLVGPDLTANDGETLSTDFYLSFYSNSEIAQEDQGKSILISWNRELNPYGYKNGAPTSDGYYYEDEGYTKFHAYIDTVSYPETLGGKSARRYGKTVEFNMNDSEFNIDYELAKYSYTLREGFEAETTYFLALDVCHYSGSYCTDLSKESSVTVK